MIVNQQNADGSWWDHGRTECHAAGPSAIARTGDAHALAPRRLCCDDGLVPRVIPALAACFLGALLLPAQAPKTPELTTCAAVRALSREQAAAQLPVRVRGVVTLAPPEARPNFTLSDGTGVWVGPTPGNAAAVQPGDLVEVEGRTHEGHFAPTIEADQVRVVGRAPLPEARRLTQLDIDSGWHDSQRVTITGVVQAEENVPRTGRSELRLIVSTPTGNFTFIQYAASPFPAGSLIDSEVSLTGVLLAYFNSRRQFLGVRVLTNDPGDLRVQRPPPADAFEAPEVPLSDSNGFSYQGTDRHRRRVRGTVTLCKPGHYFYIQEKPHALRINTRQADALQAGDIVEAAGFFQLEHHRAEMHEAVFRRIGRQSAPEPEEIARWQALVQEPRSRSAPVQDYDDYLVALRGRLISFDLKQGEPVRLNLEVDGVLVPAEFTGPSDARFVASLRPDSELLVSGICAVTFSESRPVVNWPAPVAMRLLLRGPEDVQVLKAASWWTPERLWAALGIAAVVLLIALAWVALLRRQVVQRSAQLSEEMRARRDAAVEFETTLRERTRLAADLHDTTEQSLTGLSFQLEATLALNEKAPERSRLHMGLARQLLERSREDLRRSIWNLRAVSLEQQTLAEALREVAADRGAGQVVAITVACEGEPRALPDILAGNLLLLAQEGITNALKHAQPRRIELCLSFSPRAVSLRIRDDGNGFDPSAVQGPKHGHFGLQGMRERMKRLGGQFEITSAAGQGTSITATVEV